MNFSWLFGLLLVSNLVYSQVKFSNLKDPTDWGPGFIIKEDGSKLTGGVRFNDKIGTISFLDESQKEYTYSPDLIAAFEFFDYAKSKTRQFLSIESFSDQLNKDAWRYHELLAEVGKFSIWSKLEPVNIIKIEKPGIFSTTWDQLDYDNEDRSLRKRPKQIVNQTETLYLMDVETNQLHWFMRLEVNQKVKRTRKTILGSPLHDKHPKVNFNALEDLLGTPALTSLKTFAKERKLNWKRRPDVLEILEYCKELQILN